MLAWNMANAEAGLRFQLVDRHPWAFHADGIGFVLIQAVLVMPLLFVALALAAWSRRRDDHLVARYFGLLGALLVLGFFALGFFADTERVSFHWPLPGYVALLPLLPALLLTWPRWLRVATVVTAALVTWWLISFGRLQVRVDVEALHVGRAVLPRGNVGEVQVLDPDATRRAMGVDADARAFLATRPYCKTAVRVEVADRTDPTPYWLVSSRDPAALAASLGQPGVRE